MEELSIGQTARFSGSSEQTLRLYDKAGLFPPMYRDAENGYRYYDICQNVQLGMIQHMEALDISLRDTREQVTHPELDMFKTTLHRNLGELELRSRELMYRRKAIERTLESYEWYESVPSDGTIVLEYISRGLTYMTDSGVNFYDCNIGIYEKILRDLKENLIANQFSPTYFYNVGTVIHREHLTGEGYYSTEILVLVGWGFVKDNPITEIPASTYLYTYCNGFERGKGYVGRLVEKIRAEEYQVTGDYIYETVAEVPIGIQERGAFLCLQVPVSFRRNNP